MVDPKQDEIEIGDEILLVTVLKKKRIGVSIRL